MNGFARQLNSAGPRDTVSSIGVLGLRITGGWLMLYLHGWTKFEKFGDRAARFPDPLGVSPEVSMGLTIFAEVGCAGLLLIGLFTRWSALICGFTMLVAALVVHADDPLKKQEMALLYLSIYGAVACWGGGRFSIDAKLFKTG